VGRGGEGWEGGGGGGGGGGARGGGGQEDDDGVPHAKRASEEQESPRQRRHHEEDLPCLDELSAIVTIGERAGVDGEEQERHPVADDGEASEGRGVEHLEDDPVADDVLDVVRRHRNQAPGEIAAVVGDAERGGTRGAR